MRSVEGVCPLVEEGWVMIPQALAARSIKVGCGPIILPGLPTTTTIAATISTFTSTWAMLTMAMMMMPTTTSTTTATATTGVLRAAVWVGLVLRGLETTLLWVGCTCEAEQQESLCAVSGRGMSLGRGRVG